MKRKVFAGKVVFQAFIAIFLSVVASFLVYAIVGSVFTGMQGLYFEPLSKGALNVVAKVFIVVLFPLFFHFFYTKERNKIYSQHGFKDDDSFCTRHELIAYIKWDGVPFLIAWGILAVIQSILLSIYFFTSIRNPFSVFLWFVFPLQPDTINSWSQLVISLISPVLSWCFSFPYILFLAMLSRKRMYKKMKGL